MATPLNEHLSDQEALDQLEAEVKRGRAVKDGAEKFSQANTDLVMGRDAKAVYFASCSMKLKYDPSLPAGDTAATDGKRIIYNPEFVAQQPRKKALGLLAHEVMHITNAHHARMGDRNPRTVNVAADLAINHPLVQCGFELPDGCLMPGEGPFAKYPPGLSMEEYYRLIQKDQAAGNDPLEGLPGGDDPGGCGGLRKPGNGTPAECAQAEAEAKQMVAAAEAAVRASGRGALPGIIAEQARELLQPKTNWRPYLADFLNRVSKNDYSWLHPSRRHAHRGLYLPGMRSLELGKIGLLLDESGSVSNHQFDLLGGEMNGILSSYGDCEAVIGHHSTTLAELEEYKTTDGPLKLRRVTNGGTSHREPIKRLLKEHPDVSCIICLTDLDTDFPPEAPEVPVLWVKVGNYGVKHPPFGRVIEMDDE